MIGVRAMQRWIGLRGLVAVGGDMHVMVTVADVKQAYGSLRLLVVPVMGTGQMWVEESRFQVAEAQ